MPRTEPITAEDVDAELQRMRREADQAREREGVLLDRITKLEARPESPHAKVFQEFDEDFARRVAAGKRIKAEQDAAEARKLDELCAKRTWVRVTTDISQGERTWREQVEETRSEFDAYCGPVSDGIVGQYRADKHWVTRTQNLAGGGYMLEVATEMTRRIMQSPELAHLIETGRLIVTPLTTAENRSQEQLLLRTAAAALPFGL